MHARHFGDLNDPDSEVSKILTKSPTQVVKPEMGTHPKVFYIGLDRTAVETKEESHKS